MANDRFAFEQLAAHAARLERENADLKRQLEEQEASHADRERQVSSWRRMWFDIGQQGTTAAAGYTHTAMIAQAGLYLDNASKDDCIGALDEMAKAVQPLLEVAGKLGKPFS